MMPIAPKEALERKEKTMKKTIRLVFLALVLTCLLTACGFSSGRSSRTSDNPTTEASAPTVYSVYLDFDFEQNLFMATYDIEIYLDDESIGVIEHGKAFTKQIDVEKGRHNFVFYKETDNSVSATKIFDVEQDCTVKCTLHSNTSSIDVKKFNVREGLTGNITVPKVTDKSYKEAKAQLEKAGFTNISYRTPRDATIWEAENWTVTEQSVEPGAVVDKNTEIVLSCEKPGYRFEEDTAPETESPIILETSEPVTEPAQPETAEAPPADTTTEPTEETESSTSASNKTTSQKLEEFMELVRTSAVEDENIHVEVKRYLDTVYLDVTQDGMAEVARNVIRYGGEYRNSWDYSMESLRALSQQYRDIMVETYGLRNYNFSLCLMNDEDTEYVLVEFVNGKLKRSVVE